MIAKTIRFSEELVALGEMEALKLGLTFNDLIVLSFQSFLNIQSGCQIEFFKNLRDWIITTFDPKNFPEDVTFQTFKHIQNNQELYKIYQSLVMTKSEREVIHRRIGKLVKQTLNAKVKGTSARLDPEKDLIATFSFLKPSPQK